MKPVQDIGIAQSPAGWQLGVDEEGRGAGGRREVEEWPLKVQKMASVSSITLMIVSLTKVAFFCDLQHGVDTDCL